MPTGDQAIADVPDGMFEPGTANLPGAYVARLWRLRHYVRARAAGEVEARHSETLFGRVWLYLEPFFDLMIWFVIFGLGIRAGRDIPGGGVDFFTFLAIGVTAFALLGNTWNGALPSLRENRAIPQDFPRGASTVSVITRVLYLHRFRVVIMLALVMARGTMPRLTWLLLAPLLVVSMAFAAGVGFALARVGAHRPGLDIFLRKVVQLSYWSSGALIPVEGYILRADRGEQLLEWYTTLNPIYQVVKAHQWAVMGYSAPGGERIWVMLPIWAAVTLVGGFLWMVKGESRYRMAGNVRG